MARQEAVRPARQLASASRLDEEEDDTESDSSADGDEKHQWSFAEFLFQLEIPPSPSSVQTLLRRPMISFTLASPPHQRAVAHTQACYMPCPCPCSPAIICSLPKALAVGLHAHQQFAVFETVTVQGSAPMHMHMHIDRGMSICTATLFY